MFTVNFPCISFRKIPLSPEPNNKENVLIKRYIIIVDVSELPPDFPIDTNPRDTKLTTNVAKEIKNSLIKNEFFHVLNRGILLSAKEIKHDQATSIVTINFGTDEERNLYGVVDGGHTYKIIKGAIENKCLDLDVKRYVSLEVFVGIGGNDVSIVDFAAARNSSVPVDQKSLADLEDKFEIIKKSLEAEPYYEQIGYRQNSEKAIDVKEIIALMTIFDIDRYKPTDLENQPVKAYSQKESCLQDYLTDIKGENSSYKKLCSILPEILKLSDYIRADVPETWNRELGGKIGRKLGNKINVRRDDPLYHFVPELNCYDREEEVFDTQNKSWLWLPILASMRVLVAYEGDRACFLIKNPVDFYKRNSKQLVNILYQNSKTNPAPHRIGKDKLMWTSLVQAAWMQAVQAGTLTFRRENIQ